MWKFAKLRGDRKKTNQQKNKNPCDLFIFSVLYLSIYIRDDVLIFGDDNDELPLEQLIVLLLLIIVSFLVE